MPTIRRVLPETPLLDLAAYVAAGGGTGREVAAQLTPDEVIGTIEAAGLRGRGGAGFPAATKWRAVAENRAPDVAATVVVNGAEGEPGTFKDRTILRTNPFAVLEGALIAAAAVGADEIVIALKSSFAPEASILRDAIREAQEAGWSADVAVSVFTGPGEYLYGEETALLEVLDGHMPFPRVPPPFRQGVEPDAPSLVNNVETMANVPGILANGSDWFREVGTDESPGTILCTVTGSTQSHGVGEYPMGTPLQEVIDDLGGGVRPGRRIAAVLCGVSAALLTPEQLALPLSHESMAAAGLGLGSGGFIVLDDEDDIVAAVAGASRFLAVESCGQCVPCKRDGLDISVGLAALAANQADETDVKTIASLAEVVADEARCALARQHQAVVESLLERFPDAVRAHLDATAPAVQPMLVAEVVDIDGGTAAVDETHLGKQPDWSFDHEDSGRWPAQVEMDSRVDE
jgi:NADH:ubiquinone oxidoreductase subunit F (NADH-binding)